MNKNTFLEYVKAECLKNKITFMPVEGLTTKTITKQIDCSGFFEENHKTPPTLSVATGLPDRTFFEVLAHEFSHSKQFLENSSFWKGSRLKEMEVAMYSDLSSQDLSGFEAGDLYDMWLGKEIELPAEFLKDILMRTTGVEFDCEKRTIKLIDELKLELPTKEYAQKANAYLATYFWAHKHRRWTTPGMATYTKQEVWSLFPEVIDEQFCENLPEAVDTAIWAHCVKDE